MASDILSGLVANLPQNIATGFNIAQNQQQLQNQGLDLALKEQQVANDTRQTGAIESLYNARVKRLDILRQVDEAKLEEFKEEQALAKIYEDPYTVFQRAYGSYTPAMINDMVQETRKLYPDKFADNGTLDGRSLRDYARREASGENMDTPAEIMKLHRRFGLGVKELDGRIGEAQDKLNRLTMKDGKPINSLDITEKDKIKIKELQEGLASFEASRGELLAQQMELKELLNMQKGSIDRFNVEQKNASYMNASAMELIKLDPDLTYEDALAKVMGMHGIVPPDSVLTSPNSSMRGNTTNKSDPLNMFPNDPKFNQIKDQHNSDSSIMDAVRKKVGR